MMEQLESGRELDIKIEIVKDLLCKKIKVGIGNKEIQEISERVDKLIVNYLKK